MALGRLVTSAWLIVALLLTVTCAPLSAREYRSREDRRLLEKAIKLAKTREFIEMRENFYGWWSDVVTNKMPAAGAKEDMMKRIAEYQQLIQGQAWKTTARYAITER